MDSVFDAVKKAGIAAKEFIDGTAAQSKNLIVKNAFATGRLSSDDIRKSLQHGIMYFLTRSEQSSLKSVILRTEFTASEKYKFHPNDGILPRGLNVSPFDLQSVGMPGFRRIMMEYNITPSMIVNSLRSGEMRDFANPAKSGSLFYLTADDEFILKTVRDYEANFFQSDLLNDYYHNLAKRKKSFLARYFGMFAYTQQYTFLTLRFVIMSNIIPSSLPISECFDLKGSTKGRRAMVEERYKDRPTYKDLDFIEMHPRGLFLPPDMYDRLSEILRDDVEILRGWNIIDYSLLIGIHNLSHPNAKHAHGAIAALGEATASIPFVSINAKPSPGWNLSDRDTNQRGWNCPITRMFPDDISSARMYNHPSAMVYGGIPAMNAKGEKLAIFLGIIDILQTYDASKQVQNYVQGIQDSDEYSRSIIEPCQYASRFLDFILGNVFHRGKSDLGTNRMGSMSTNSMPNAPVEDNPYSPLIYTPHESNPYNVRMDYAPCQPGMLIQPNANERFMPHHQSISPNQRYHSSRPNDHQSIGPNQKYSNDKYSSVYEPHYMDPPIVKRQPSSNVPYPTKQCSFPDPNECIRKSNIIETNSDLSLPRSTMPPLPQDYQVFSIPLEHKNRSQHLPKSASIFPNTQNF